ALVEPLDEALSLWKRLLENPGIPDVRSPEQTVTSLQLLASLYRLQAQPLQALESFQLLRSLCRRLGDHSGAADALCQLARLLLQLECPSQAQVFLEELELCPAEAEGSE
ncbi:ESPL1 protein, partial [Machaerirhynchus nigripectus]|nr:ESPL1 protein [Machaerirhynchus nigripectus]